MDKQQIIEGNEAIAKFMGYKIIHRPKNIPYRCSVGTAQNTLDTIQYWKDELDNHEILHYHEDWNWLMPVYKKLHEPQYRNIESIEWSMLMGKLSLAVLTAELTEVWANAVALINLLESNKTSQHGT